MVVSFKARRFPVRTGDDRSDGLEGGDAASRKEGKSVSEAGADLIQLTANIVSAYVTRNHIEVERLGGVLASVHSALSKLNPSSVATKPTEPLTPHMPIRKTITPDHLISLEDGKKYRSLKRHLAVRGLTPQGYRTKWGLPLDYPMTAPSYTAARSQLAKELGLGRKPPADGRHRRSRKR